jgi:GNAT superfamily N-acetyltransferase
VSKAFVLPGSVEAGEPIVLGYYTLSMALLGSSEASSVLRTRLPRYPMPVALIGRLAVHELARGRWLGELLLGDAFDRVVALADQIGCLGVVVDAKDEEAERFYLKYAFTSVDETSSPKRMFLPLESLRMEIGAG